MVVKRRMCERGSLSGFESSVISYGSKTSEKIKKYLSPFESSVISYGSKTKI